MVYTQKDKLFLWTVQSVSVIYSVNIKCLGKSEMIKTTDLKETPFLWQDYKVCVNAVKQNILQPIVNKNMLVSYKIYHMWYAKKQLQIYQSYEYN